jgi:excisionase family DNA binding protein
MNWKSTFKWEFKMGVFLLPQSDSAVSSEQPDVYMPAQAAADYSGYNLQYIRRLLNGGVLEGVKVGQVWLVKVASLDAYLKSVRKTNDRRYGPRVYQEYIESQES